MPRSEGREHDRRKRARFNRIVRDAIDDLATEIERRRDDGNLNAALAQRFLEALDEVPVVIEDGPDARQRDENEDADRLLGLYEGVPMIEWGSDHTAIPARITIFWRATERMTASPERQRDEVRKTLRHEIGHHLGLSDERLNELGLGDAD